MSDPTRPEPHAARLLRQRLLLSLGLTATVLPGCIGGKCGDTTYTTTVSLDAVAADTGSDTGHATGSDTGTSLTECPVDPDEILDLMLANGEGCSLATVMLVEQDGRNCTYEYSCYTCCGYGRPYLDDTGAPVEADTRPSNTWTDGAESPDLSGLSPEERQAIGQYWLKNATAEHSSVAGFHRFALDLLAHGAPPELVARAQRAASQELRHAIDCFTLASAYLGEPVGPAPMKLGQHAPIASSLAELAAWTARDGAIGETMAALLAEAALHDSADPAVRRVLTIIVADETEHAELAWATLRWAIETGGDEVRDAVRAVLAGLTQPQSDNARWTTRLAAHGVPSPDEEPAVANTAIHHVILPVAQALLESARAA